MADCVVGGDHDPEQRARMHERGEQQPWQIKPGGIATLAAG
jgi:hypothetical protein